jgi:signal transduction histidine kinase
VPEVTFFVRPLELAHATAQAARMWNRLRPLFDPMNLAAYLAWAGTGSELWLGHNESTGVVPDALSLPLALGLHGLFLLLFVVCRLAGEGSRAQWLFVWLQLATALVLIAVARFTSFPVLLVVVLSQMATKYRPAWLAVIFFAANLSLYLLVRDLWGMQAPLVMVTIYASFDLFAMLTAWYAVTAQRSRDELVSVNADLLATRSLLTESVRDSERLRLSRELHDIAGHKLTALKLNLAALARDPQVGANPAVPLCAQLADELLADIRGVVQQMRLHDGMDLRSALAALAAPFPKPQVHFELTEAARVADVAQAEAVLRTVQEALTNAARHSNAENIWIVLRRDGDRIILDIRDDGRGVGALRFGHGLSGMRERLEAIDGQLQVERNPAGGVQLQARLPALL